MTTKLTPRRINPGPRRRHESRVERFSANPDLLGYLDGLSVVETEARHLVDAVCWELGVEPPRLRFHARRSPYTGATEQPRWFLIESLGEDRVARIEANRSVRLPEHGAIRLGRTTTLMTVAHELGHHLVFVLDPLATPGHGKRWVRRFDQVADLISRLI